MTCSVEWQLVGPIFYLTIEGSLTYADVGSLAGGKQAELLQSIRSARSGLRSVVVDIGRVRALDSCGVGLLVLVHEAAGDLATLQVRGANASTGKVLRIAQLHRLMQIE